MIETLLIANRGEIAQRILRTCREMGIRTVAVYSDADRDQPHLDAADVALRLGPPPPAESYLDGEKLLALAQGNGVDAIHPGYGFLAENPEFSAACARAGVTFIGPSAEVIRAMGDKGEAKRRMEEAGVPVVPGYFGGEQDETVLLKAAREIGFPVLLKAVAGGGGRGIRAVSEESAFSEEMASARREAGNAFGDGRMMIEKYLPAPHHVEFQVLADTQGTVLHLFERECSVQRRHQKIVEETPSPALDADLRGKMAEAAVRAARAIGYVGAGTVEFLLEDDGSFYFLEMNTRLQVEHPVTEMTLGLDLVRLQIEVAEGRPLTLRQEDLVPSGHAIECRLNAEDPARSFLPSVGTLRAFSFPEGPGLRVDAGYAEGAALTPHYDSLLAKLIAWGPTRGEALRRMRRLLSESRVAGIASNLAFLQAVIAHPAFRGGDYSTRFLDEHGDALTTPELSPTLQREWLLAAAAVDARLEIQRQSRNSWNGGGSGAPDGQAEGTRMRRIPARLNRRYTLGGERREVSIEVLSGKENTLDICAVWEGVPHRAVLAPAAGNEGAESGQGVLDLEEARLPLRWDAAGAQRWLTLRGTHLVYTSEDPARDSKATAAGADERLRAPLPGKIIKMEVNPGDAVRENQLLLVLEAMKVEHKITAPYTGKVTVLHFGEGDQVNRDDPLLALEPDAT